ncbi:MAG: discoidin domain-containing protein [Verrucomicrobiota bacterium]
MNKTTLAIAALAALSTAVSAQDTEEIKIEFPKPMFIGTPVPAKLPNLETPDPSKIIKSFQAPKGTVNLAKGKEVTSSDPAPIIGDLPLVTDGDADGSDGCFVELAPGPQWVQIDLGASTTLNKIAMWHYHKQAQAYVDVVVQVSDDKEFKTGVTTLFNSDHDDTLKLGAGADPAYIETNHGRVIDAKNTKAQFVRLTSNGNTSNEMNHYCEVQVFGVPGK